MLEGARDEAPKVVEVSTFGVDAHHCKGLACPGLPVREDGTVVS